ncbi:hypothetical protein Hanom_Chr04g00364921 [Helianthus anomalus]
MKVLIKTNKRKRGKHKHTFWCVCVDRPKQGPRRPNPNFTNSPKSEGNLGF